MHQSGYLAQPNRGLSRDERGARPDRRELAGQVGQFRTTDADFWKPVSALRILRPGGKRLQATERRTERLPKPFANQNSRLNRALKFSGVRPTRGGTAPFQINEVIGAVLEIPQEPR